MCNPCPRLVSHFTCIIINKVQVQVDFNLQMSPTKVARGICYSPEKRLKLKEIEEKKIPVIIDNVQRSVARRRATEQE